ncbi:MAG: LON peptidase substrate-binding domain-containing protein [Planctomycetota bacterium]
MDDEFLMIPDVVPVFPLSQIVLFPRMIVPLHIYEPRYREMFSDVLAGSRIVAVALLKPGFEPLYHTPRAPIYTTLGLGQIMESERVAGGNYNVLLRGVGRATIVAELPSDESNASYRQARVELLDTFCSGDDSRANELRSQLFAAIRGNPAFDPELRKHWLKLRKADLDLDVLSDLLAAGIPVEAELRQVLFEEVDALERARLLLEQVRTLGAIARRQLRVPRLDEYNLN